MRVLILTSLLLLAAVPAFAAGYDSIVPWSGRYGGTADAAVATVEGAQALYFNPAGLSLSKGIDVDLEFSPTFTQFHGPITSSAAASSSRAFSPSYSAIVGYRVSKRIGVGAGIFTAGGSSADFGSVDFGVLNAEYAGLHPTIRSYTNIVEGSLGGSFEILDGLRVGAAWRMTYFSTDLETAVPSGAGQLNAVSLNTLVDIPMYGFRVGALYSPRSGLFGLGVNWRTPESFNATGSFSQTTLTAGASSKPAATTGTAILKTALPSQLSIGGFVAPFWQLLRIAFEYDFTNDASDTRIGISGLPTTSGATLTSIPLGWYDEHTFRIGAEYLGFEHWALRAGYALTTQVTSSTNAQATMFPPGVGHTVTIGFGRSFAHDRARVDVAGEYSVSSGSGTNLYGVNGAFASSLWAAHVGTSYAF